MVEFVNDADLDISRVDDLYGEILSRLRDLGAEVILCTPHFTSMEMMGFRALTEPDRRPYVHALRRFTDSNHIALADVSARWEHLWKEGVPYVTLLSNAINHPDDRGHRIYAEEVLKCFD